MTILSDLLGGTYNGATGATGAPGASGVNGATGLTGATGIAGSTGPQGIQGASGATGIAGTTGIQGASGSTGITGASGVQGASGSTGPQGIQGASGSTGIAGTTGVQGASGATGIQGASGSTGIAGTTGPQGIQGASGATGIAGTTGIQGASGSTGIAGTTGISGASGASGATGIAGATGPQGIQGASGATGIAGTTGISGASGASGATGIAGATGPRGASGATGLTGATGTPGISATGRIWYYSSLTSDLSDPQTAKPYEILKPDNPSTLVEDDMFAYANVNTGEVFISGHATANGDPNITEVPAGEYKWRIWRYVSSTSGNSEMVLRVNEVQVSNSNYQVEIFNLTTGKIIDTTPTYQEIVVYATQPYPMYDANSRVVVEAFAKSDSASNVAVHFIHDGPTRQSSIVTAITAGFTGPTGATGPQGIQGASGSTGTQGIQGSSGASGATGPQGTPGASGASGATGPQGAPGASGASGATGPQGIQGSSGASGATGPQGAPGASGASGASGATGTAGINGATGPQGIPGATGTAGINGATGPQGIPGASGASGASGATGTAGIDGATGPQGIPGASGASGATGTAGIDGATGTQGIPGATGPQGIPGASGPQGASGATGPTYTFIPNLFYEPFVPVQAASTIPVQTNFSWYLHPFVLPAPFPGGRLNYLFTNQTSASNFFNRTVNFTASSGTAVLSGTYFKRFALYNNFSNTTGANSTNIGKISTLWTGSADILFTHSIVESATGGASQTVSNYATIGLINQVNSTGGVSTSNFTTSGTITFAASLLSSSAQSLVSGLANYITGSIMGMVGINTTLDYGEYILAYMHGTSTSATQTGQISGNQQQVFPASNLSYFGQQEYVSMSQFRQLGRSTSNSTQTQVIPWHGYVATTSTGAFSTLASTDIRNFSISTGAGGQSRFYFNMIQDTVTTA